MAQRRFVLVAVDMETGTDLALDTAVAMASASPDTSLIVLHVFGPFAGGELRPEASAEASKKVEFVRAQVEKALSRFASSHPAAPLPTAQVQISIGQPGTEIVWAAAHFDADAVVVASHGRHGLKRLLLGSVAEKVVRLAGCPVIVARAKAHDPTAKIPEIVPLCDDCAERRAKTAGRELWCERHAAHHPHAHTYSSAGRTDPLPAWGAATGS